MPPRRAPIADGQADNVEDGHVNAHMPPNGDAATRALDGMAHLFEHFQQANRPQHNGYDQFWRLAPKEFSGTTDPFAAEAWIRALEVHFRCLDMGDADRVRCATYMFRDDASLWWEEVDHGFNLVTLTWARFKEIFYEKDVAENMRHFLDGLPPDIHRDVMMIRPLDYAAATAYAFQAEQALKEIDFDMQRKRKQHQQNNQTNKKPYMGPPRPQGCFICKEEGHKAADCPKKNTPTVGRAYVMHAKESEEEPDTTLITDNLVI
ncbi:uncharacterized protein LOC142541845 [Primulina tabacum]|uniref:uncharacterized protein LOC142541845 n=1 Tax=Primulina tabacum TaxID=48773 RepID=UPI003F5A1E3F